MISSLPEAAAVLVGAAEAAREVEVGVACGQEAAGEPCAREGARTSAVGHGWAARTSVEAVEPEWAAEPPTWVQEAAPEWEVGAAVVERAWGVPLTQAAELVVVFPISVREVEHAWVACRISAAVSVVDLLISAQEVELVPAERRQIWGPAEPGGSAASPIWGRG